MCAWDVYITLTLNKSWKVKYITSWGVPRRNLISEARAEEIQRESKFLGVPRRVPRRNTKRGS